MFHIVLTIFGTVLAVIPCEHCETMQECNREARTFIEPAELGGLNYCAYGEPPQPEALNEWEQQRYDEWQRAQSGE